MEEQLKMWYGILNSTYDFGNSKSVMTPLLFKEKSELFKEKSERT